MESKNHNRPQPTKDLEFSESRLGHAVLRTNFSGQGLFGNKAQSERGEDNTGSPQSKTHVCVMQDLGHTHWGFAAREAEMLHHCAVLHLMEVFPYLIANPHTVPMPL